MPAALRAAPVEEQHDPAAAARARRTDKTHRLDLYAVGTERDCVEASESGGVLVLATDRHAELLDFYIRRRLCELRLL